MPIEIGHVEAIVGTVTRIGRLAVGQTIILHAAALTHLRVVRGGGSS